MANPENPLNPLDANRRPLQRTARPPATQWRGGLNGDLAPAPTKEQINKANRGELADKGFLGKVVAFSKDHPVIAAEIGVLVGVSGLTAGVATAVYALGHPGIFEPAPKGTSFDQNDPKLVFDNRFLEGEINGNNTVQLTQEEIDALPEVDEDGNELYLYPFQQNDAFVSLKTNFKKNAIVRDGEIIYGDFRQDELKTNTNIIAWHDGYAFASRSKESGKIREDGLTIIFSNSKGDIFATGVNNGSIGSPTFGFNIAYSIPSLDSNVNNSGRDYIKGKFVKKGEKLGVVTKDLKGVSFQIMKVPNGNYYDRKMVTTDDVIFYELDNKLATKSPK